MDDVEDGGQLDGNSNLGTVHQAELKKRCQGNCRNTEQGSAKQEEVPASVVQVNGCYAAGADQEKEGDNVEAPNPPTKPCPRDCFSKEGISPAYYFRAKRSKSAIWRSISSRAESEAERMPWMRRRNSSGLEARLRASSRVMSCLV